MNRNTKIRITKIINKLNNESLDGMSNTTMEP